MPELPEVETARRLIAGRALHRTIVGVNDADTYVTRPHTPGQLRDALVGRELTAVMTARQDHLGRDLRRGRGPCARP